MSRIILSPLHYLAIAALAVPLLGLGYIAGNGDMLKVYRLNLEMSLSGKGGDYDGKIPDATQPILPIIAEANDLFDIKGKGPRADLLYRQRVANNGDYEERRRLAQQEIESENIVQAETVNNTYELVQQVNREGKSNRQSVKCLAVAPDPVGIRVPQKVTAGLPIISQKRVAGVFDMHRDAHFGMDRKHVGSQIRKDVARVNTKIESGEKPDYTGLEVKHVASVTAGAGARKFFGGLTEHEFRKREHRCLATAIYFEARREPVKGQLAVAQVIMNRVRSSYYADTVCGVVYEGAHKRNACQFSFACDGAADKPRDKKRWVIAMDLARKVTDGKVWLKDIGYASHYHANYVKPSWRRSMKLIKQIGVHIFYRAKFFARPTEVAAIQ